MGISDKFPGWNSESRIKRLLAKSIYGFIAFWIFITILTIMVVMRPDAPKTEAPVITQMPVTTTLAPTTQPPVTEPPQTTQPPAPMTQPEEEGLSLSKQKKLFYDLVAEQDKCYDLYDITGDLKDLPGPECDQAAYVTVAEKYGVTVDEVKKIALTGAMERWPMPPS